VTASHRGAGTSAARDGQPCSVDRGASSSCRSRHLAAGMGGDGCTPRRNPDDVLPCSGGRPSLSGVIWWLPLCHLGGVGCTGRVPRPRSGSGRLPHCWYCSARAAPRRWTAEARSSMPTTSLRRHCGGPAVEALDMLMVVRCQVRRDSAACSRSMLERPAPQHSFASRSHCPQRVSQTNR
jgi:hypothetical protein